jgi:signal transduction histidine kinase
MEEKGFRAQDSLTQMQGLQDLLSSAEEHLEALIEDPSILGENPKNEHLGEVLRIIQKARQQAENELLGFNQKLELIIKEQTEELAKIKRRRMKREEAELTHLARELHDGPMQDIYGLTYHIVSVTSDISPENLNNELKYIRKELLRINSALRATSQELFPPSLAHYGLAISIEGHASKLQQANPDLNIKLNLHQNGILLDHHVRLSLYRIYQISITNVIRHAKAQNVNIYLEINDGYCLMEIQDDGVGFEVPNNFNELAQRGHTGLINAQERADAFGGRLELHSRPGHGTTLRVVLPVAT